MSQAGARLSWYCRMTPERRAATIEYNRALRSRQIVRQPCQVCGATESIHGHHTDYAKPLDVMWLCQEHHLQWHEQHGQGLNNGDPEGQYPRRTNLVGRRFGKLTVASRVDGRKSPNGCYMWLCDCECGSRVVRSTQNLRHAPYASCVSCRRARRDWERHQRTQRRVELAKRDASWLYSTQAIERISNDIRRSIAAEIGFLPVEVVDRFTSLTTWVGGVSPSTVERLDSPELWGMKSKQSETERRRAKHAGRKSAAIRAARKAA